MMIELLRSPEFNVAVENHTSQEFVLITGNPARLGEEPGMTVAEIWKTITRGRDLDRVAMAISWEGSYINARTIILGPIFHNPKAFTDIKGVKDLLEAYGNSTSAFQRGTLIHEFAHIIFNMGDNELAAFWDLANKGYDISNASSAIGLFIANDCKPKSN